MATAVFPGAPQPPRPVLVPARETEGFSESDAGAGSLECRGPDDSIGLRVRIMGGTLLTLGHAAEHLAESAAVLEQEGEPGGECGGDPHSDGRQPDGV